MATRKPVRRTQEERSKDTQGRVIAAAVEALRSKGYVGFRVSEVAEAAKVSRGAQTHHFPTKDSLVLAALEHIFRESMEHSLQRAKSLKPGDDVMAALLRDGEEFFLGPYFPIALDMLNLGNHGAKLRKQVQTMSRQHRIPVEEVWSMALIERGLSAKQAEDMLWLSYSIIRGLAIRRLMQDDPRIQGVISLWHDIADALIAGRAPVLPG
jgi:AcrR family transcriptional regulator